MQTKKNQNNEYIDSDAIKRLEKRYLRWKKKQDLNRHLEFEEFHAGEPVDLDLERRWDVD